MATRRDLTCLPRLGAVATEAVLYVRDLEVMAAFYGHGLGLRLDETGDGYRGLRSKGFTVWLVRGNPQPQDDAADDEPARRRSDVTVKLGFELPSIELASSTITSLGGRISAKSWEFAGYLRRDVVDPEGNVLQLLERLALLDE
jgi:catechol 2,3-dioxygenase-like lactoylglutathione lyase family enzyme